jgi:DNA-binding transcriptional ArsR family regulator
MEICHKSRSGALPDCPAQPRITAREASITIGITERATRGIINELEADGYVTKKRQGRRIRYRLNPNLPLRAEMQQDKDVGSLLEVLGWERRRKQTIKEMAS